MSIVTLKKKAAAQYRNLSVSSPTKNNHGFSINGTHRSQGWVGQTSLSRSLPRTLMKGSTLRGHGGCCGKYPIKNIVQSAVTSTADSRVVKSSVLGTSGMISTHYRWIRRPQPFTSVKPDNNNNINTQEQYIDGIKKATISQAAACNINKKVGFTTKTGCANLTGYQQPTTCNLIVDPNKPQYISQSEYIENINNKCGVLLDIKYVPRSQKHTPFACKSTTAYSGNL